MAKKKKEKWMPNDTVLQKVMEFEKFMPEIYDDGKGIKTIGYGFTDKNTLKKYRKGISKKEAKKLFMKKAEEYASYVQDAPNFDKMDEGKRNALFSYIYNIGPTKFWKTHTQLVKALKDEDWEKAAQEINADYSNPNFKGAKPRREYERALFGFGTSEDGSVYDLSKQKPGPTKEEIINSRNTTKQYAANVMKASKNDIELQDPFVTTFNEAYSYATKNKKPVFKWDGKEYKSGFIKKDGGSTDKNEQNLIASKQKQIYTYLTSERGFKPVQALAVIGNVMAESGLKEDVYGDNNTSYGIQQWHNERKDKLFKEAKKKGHDVPTFEDQIEFLADEYEGKTGYTNFLYKTRGKKKSGYYNYSQKEFEEAGSLRDAVVAWNQGAGRPHKSVIRNDDRYKAALEAAQNIGVEIEDGPSYYTEDGFNPDAIPETDTEIIEPEDEVLVEGQDTNEDLKDWIRSYGEEMLYKMMSMSNNAVKPDPDEEQVEANEISEQDKQDKIQDQKRQALISAFLPNLQLKIKGVTEVRD